MVLPVLSQDPLCLVLENFQGKLRVGGGQSGDGEVGAGRRARELVSMRTTPGLELNETRQCHLLFTPARKNYACSGWGTV